MSDEINDEKKLPWPEESDPAKLGERMEHGPTPDERDVGSSFVASNEASELALGREFADSRSTDRHKLADSFADPNSLDDKRIGKNFEETNSSRKKKHEPLSRRVHKPKNRRPLYIGLAVFAVIFLLVLLVGGLPKLFRDHDIDKRAKQTRDEKPVVEVARVSSSLAQAGLTLPGTTIPLNEAFVYARANGYLKSYKVDIGDHVKKGQVLAVIDAPDLDAQVDQARQQVRQAEQQLEQQKSQLALETVTVQRYRVLVIKGVLSRQQGDQQEANYASAEANVAAAQRNVQAYEANLQRVIDLQSYEYVRAPFDGVVTQRNVDTGALISAAGSTGGPIAGPAPQGQASTAGGTSQAAQTNSSGSSGSPNTSATSQQSPGQGGPLFGIAQTWKLRTLVSVPEGYAPFIHPGQHAQVAFQEYPGADVDGLVTRTADSVDQNTRTMLTEVEIDNRDNKLVAGMYAVVTFPPSPGQKAPLVVTGDAVAVRNDQSTLAIVKDGKIHMVPVTLGRDYGDVVEVLTGVQAGDLVVTNITDDVVDGAEVTTKMVKSPEQKPQAAPPQNTPPGGSTRYSTNALTDENLQGEQQQQDQKTVGKGEAQKSAGSQSKP
jgi:multidrug efflux pump subunit AcrA (membrane-fusion protein)